MTVPTICPVCKKPGTIDGEQRKPGVETIPGGLPVQVINGVDTVIAPHANHSKKERTAALEGFVDANGKAISEE